MHFIRCNFAQHPHRHVNLQPPSPLRYKLRVESLNGAESRYVLVPRRGLTTLPQFPGILTIASIVLGLPLALWTYKCCVMVVFQRKIIYMGYVPLGARRDELRDVPTSFLDGIKCQELTISGSDGVKLAGIEVERDTATPSKNPPTIMMYLQGNAGNPLHRLPVFQTLLSSRAAQSHLKIVSVSPRSYWKSTMRRPTQHGILRDYTAVLQHILHHYPDSPVILYGHSLGGAVAVCLCDSLSGDRGTEIQNVSSVPIAQRDDLRRVAGLVLENPFSSVPDMVCALYPQRWLPYHYLSPFVFDKWDARRALVHAALPDSKQETVLSRLARDMMVLVSEKDEMVPPAMGLSLLEASKALRTENCQNRQLGTLEFVHGALHEDMWKKWEWVRHMNRYIQNVEEQLAKRRLTGVGI